MKASLTPADREAELASRKCHLWKREFRLAIFGAIGAGRVAASLVSFHNEDPMRVHIQLATAALCALVVGQPQARAADPDVAALQGKWLVESFAYNGSPVEAMQGATREIKEEKYSLTPTGGDAINGTIKVDSTKKPKQIDLDVNGRTLKGIYEIQGEMLKLCYRLNGDERPTEFESKPDSGAVLVLHRRAK